jgi:hypothetical protein
VATNSFNDGNASAAADANAADDIAARLVATRRLQMQQACVLLSECCHDRSVGAVASVRASRCDRVPRSIRCAHEDEPNREKVTFDDCSRRAYERVIIKNTEKKKEK